MADLEIGRWVHGADHMRFFLVAPCTGKYSLGPGWLMLRMRGRCVWELEKVLLKGYHNEEGCRVTGK